MRLFHLPRRSHFWRNHSSEKYRGREFRDVVNFLPSMRDIPDATTAKPVEGVQRESVRKISAPPREIRVDKLDRRNSSEWNILSISRQWSVGRLARQPTFYCIAMCTPFLVSGIFCGRECKEDVRGVERIRFYLSSHIRCFLFCSSTALYRVHAQVESQVDLMVPFFQINNVFDFPSD